MTESTDYDFDVNQFEVSDNAVSIKDIFVKRTDSILIPGSNISTLTNDSGYITDGNTNWDNSYGYITASSSDALTNKSGNISMWTNDSGYITGSSSSALTNKTGNISMWTNDSGYITDGNTNWDNSYGFITDGNTGWDNSYNFITASSSDALTNKTGNISMWNNDSGYITDGNTGWDNSYGFITDGNTNWDNSYGFITDGNTGWDNSYNFITASSSDALTNKTGNISMWTNDANFITLTSLSSSATGLTYTNTTGVFSLSSGYVIPTTTQETNWGTAYTNRVDTWNYPLSISSNAVSLGYNTTNLKITSNQLNTIQDIATTSSPTFTNATLSNNLAVAGKVGIGSTDPQKKLEINDNDADTTTSGVRFGNFVCTSSDKLTVDVNGDIVCATDQTGSGTGNIIDTLADTLAAGNNANSLNITNIGRLYTAIGLVGTPSFSFQSDQDTGMYSSGTDTLNFTTNGTERMRVGSTGNVGVGTTNPTSKLHIAGNTLTEGNIIPEMTGATGFVSTRTIGDTNNRFSDIWTEEMHIGASSLYVNGKKVISDVSDVMNFTTDTDQSMIIKSVGSGNLTMQTDTGTLFLTGNNISSTTTGQFSVTGKGGIGLTVPSDNASQNLNLTNNSLNGNINLTTTGGNSRIALNAVTGVSLTSPALDLLGHVSVGTTDAVKNLTVSGTINTATISGGTLTSSAVNGVTTANILTTGSSFSGDVSGTYNNLAVSDDSHAHTTTTISGLDISSDTNLSGDTEIVLTDDALSIASSITRDSELSSYMPLVNISGTTNYLSKFSGTNSLASSLLFDSGTNIGIGTTDPTHKLDVSGNIGLSAGAYLNFGATDGETGYGVRDNSGTIQVKNSGGDWTNIPTSGFSQWTTAGSDIYYNTGGVGIGTTAPAGKLTVYSNTIGAPATSGSTDPNVISRILGGSVALDTGSYSTGTMWLQSRLASNLATNYNMVFQPNGGNVGIGTSTPRASLDVSSTVNPHAVFGSVFPVYLVSNIPTIGFNAYYIAGNGWRFGSGSSSSYAGDFNFNPSTGLFRIRSSSNTGNADESASLVERFVVNSSGNVGIGTASPAYKLDVAGTMNAQEVRVNGVVLSPGTGSNWTVSGGNVYRASGNVGIGTASPGAPLTIYNATDTTIRATTANYSTNFGQYEGSWIGLNNPTIIQPIGNSHDIAITGVTNSPTSGIVIKSTGNVGIGTTSPHKKLSVKLHDTALGTYYAATFGGSYHLPGYAVGIGLDPEGYGNRNKVGIIAEGTGGWSVAKLHFAMRNDYTYTEAGISDAKMTIQSDGNVGIGTTAPNTKLEVYNNAPNNKIRLSASKDSNAGVQPIGEIEVGYTDSAWASGYFGINAPSTTPYEVDPIRAITILSSGNVGIGTTSPSTALDVNGQIFGVSSSGYLIKQGGGFNTGLFIESDNGISIFRGGSRILNAGSGSTSNVGIGVSAPTYKLQLNGQPAANGYTAWTNYSDSRLKENITPFISGSILDKISQLNPVTFNYNSLTGYDAETRARRVSGFIAQELQQVFPEMVGETTINGTKYLDTNTSNLQLYMLEGIQELAVQTSSINNNWVMQNGQIKITSLEDQIAELNNEWVINNGEDEIEQLKARVAALENSNDNVSVTNENINENLNSNDNVAIDPAVVLPEADKSANNNENLNGNENLNSNDNLNIDQQINDQLSLLGIGDIGGTITAFFKEVWFEAKVTFEKAVVFFDRVTFNKAVALNKNMANEVTLLAGTKQTRITFEENFFAQKPVVTVTPMDFIDGEYRVTEVSTTGFMIELEKEQATDLVFSWHAFEREAELTPTAD